MATRRSSAESPQGREPGSDQKANTSAISPVVPHGLAAVVQVDAGRRVLGPATAKQAAAEMRDVGIDAMTRARFRIAWRGEGANRPPQSTESAAVAIGGITTLDERYVGDQLVEAITN